MEIPRSLLDELSEEVNALSGAAQAQATIALNNLFAEWDGSDYDALRTAALAVLESILGAYTDMAAARAAESYDAMRAAQAAGGTYAAVADSRRKPGATQGAMYAITKTFEQTQSEDRFMAEVLDRVDTEMRRAANQCIAHNASRDPRKPTYARVPVGETCGFCLMLASFGYQYTSEEAASHAHRKCNCRIVPSFGDAEVKGYDPDAMYGRFNDCMAAIGGRQGIRDEWNALPKAEREAYTKKHGNKAGEAFDAYVNKRVSQEIETRDPEWFVTGKVPSVDFASKEVEKRATDAEKRTARLLAEHGIKPVFIQDFEVVRVDGRKQRIGLPDLENGIEIKTLGTSGNAHGAVKNYLGNAEKKKGLRCVVIDNSESLHISDDDLKKAAADLAGDYPGIPGLRLLLKDGTYFKVK